MQEDYQNSEDNNEEEFEDEHIPVHPESLGRGQKIAAAILAVFAVAVVGVWMVQFKKSITGPLNYDNNTGTNSAAPAQPQEENSEDALRAKDTDKDGLSDWDELYIYKTSPYLKDSDSDGFTDKEEIDSGNDPNCPVGRNCYGSSGVSPINSTATSSMSGLNSQNNQNNVNPFSGLVAQPEVSGALKQTDNSAAMQAISSGQLDAATLRQMLLSGGMDKKLLDKVSDSDLIKSYQEMLNK